MFTRPPRSLRDIDAALRRAAAVKLDAGPDSLARRVALERVDRLLDERLVLMRMFGRTAAA